MFCTKCGNKLGDSDLFCSKCGQKVGGSVELKTTHISKPSKPNRILKEDDFKLGGTTIMNEKARLQLYEDRIEWKGKNPFTIMISDITNVSVKDSFGCGYLIIRTPDGETKFAMINKLTQFMVVFGPEYTATDKKIMDLHYWREEIERLRH